MTTNQPNQPPITTTDDTQAHSAHFGSPAEQPRPKPTACGYDGAPVEGPETQAHIIRVNGPAEGTEVEAHAAKFGKPLACPETEAHQFNIAPAEGPETEAQARCFGPVEESETEAHTFKIAGPAEIAETEAHYYRLNQDNPGQPAPATGCRDCASRNR
jgi:hypothetical protein